MSKRAFGRVVAASLLLFMFACSRDVTPAATGGARGQSPSGAGEPATAITPAGADAGSASSALTDGGSGADGAAGSLAGPHPFGSHTFAYPSGSIRPTGDPRALDLATASFYDRWKAALVKKGCGGYYVLTSGGTGASAGAFTVSEGHGYGMLIVSMMAGYDPDARAVFDGMYTVFRKTPSVNDPRLMGWEILRDAKGRCTTETSNRKDRNDSATDGDLDIAFSLLVAHSQWGSGGTIDYLGEARKIISAIMEHDVNHETRLLLLGDWADIKAPYYHAGSAQDTADGIKYYYGTRPSDFMMDHLKAFEVASGDDAWNKIVDAHYSLLQSVQTEFAPSTGLVPDFVVNTNASPAPAPPKYLEEPTDGIYWENACRVPWRLGTDYIATGEPRAKAALKPLNEWIRSVTGGDPRKIKNGYTLAGVAKRTKPDLPFVAPFGVSAMTDPGNQAWLDAIWTALVKNDSVDYYGASIKLVAMIVMSGNWFQP